MRRILGWLIACIARLWISTLRVRHVGGVITDPSIAAFLHGDQLPLLRARPAASETVPVSLSRDGDLQALVLGHLGMNVVRGSSSRGGAAVTRALMASLSHGDVVLIAVDGPRGPRGQAKPGAVFLSIKSGAPIFPVSLAATAGVRLGRSWDLFFLPRPFSRVCIHVGAAWHPPTDASLGKSCRVLTKLLEEGERIAHETLDEGFS